MKQSHHNGSKIPIDWVMSQALGGNNIDSETYRLRANHEDNIRIFQNSLKSKCAEAESLKTELENKFSDKIIHNVQCDDLLAEARTIIPYKAREIKRAEQSQEAFRLRHGLTREPVSPKTAQNIMFLIILMFGEAGINSSFFQNAYMVASPFSALMTSLLISVTNVLACTCAGFFIGRWKHYGANAVDANYDFFTSRRNQAKILFWCFIAVITFFHTTVGLVRALESLDKVEHSIVAYLAIITTPEALFLVITGSCLSILAYQKGKHAFADPYPEFGERHEAVTKLHDDLVDVFDDFTQLIEERFDDAILTIEKLIKKQQLSLKKYNQCITSCMNAKRDLEQAVSKAESQINMQLSQISDHHSSISGANSCSAANNAKRPVSFKNYLNFDVPAFHHPPDMKAQTAKLNEERALALKQLNTIFQVVFEHNIGDKS